MARGFKIVKVDVVFLNEIANCCHEKKKTLNSM